MKKLTKRPQMLLYAISGMGVNMLNLMMGSYICSALLVGGFGEAAIPYQTFTGHDIVIAAVWGTMVFLAKVVDGVIDIPMASFTDRLKTRFGRRRPALLIGLVPMIAAYLLFLVIPDRSGASLLNTVYYGILLMIFYSFYTLTMVTYYSTFTEIVGTVQDRNFLGNVKSVCDILYFILGYVVVRMLLNGLNIRIVALIVLPLVMTMLIPFFMIKEQSTLPEDVEKRRAAGEVSDLGEPLQTVNLIRSLVVTFKNRGFIIWMVVYSLMTFGVQLFLGGINEYFSYVGMSMIYVMMSAFAPVPFTLLIYNKLMKTRGFGFSFRYTLLMFALGMGAMFGVSFLQQGMLKTILSIVTGLISSLAIGSLFSVAYSVPAELAAEEEKKTGISNSAMYFAVQGLFAGVATAVGTGLVLTALKGSEEQQSGNITYMTLIAAIGMIVAFLLTYILPQSIVRMGKEK